MNSLSYRKLLCVGFLLSLLYRSPVLAQPIQKVWDKLLQTDNFESRLSFIRLTENKIMVVCQSGSDSAYDKSMNGPGGFGVPTDEPWLICLDTLGNKVWDKDLWGVGGMIWNGLVRISDDSMAICNLVGIGNPVYDDTCHSRRYVNLSSWVAIMDSLGNVGWNNLFGLGKDSLDLNNTNHHTLSPISLTYSHRKLQVSGTVEMVPTFIGGDLTAINCTNYPPPLSLSQPHNPSQYTDFFMYETDPYSTANYGHTWQHVYGGDSIESCYISIPVSDGGFLLGGYTTSRASCSQTVSAYVSQKRDCWVIKTDSTGNIQWQHLFGGINGDWLLKAVEAGNGNYLLAGYTFSPQGYDVSSSTAPNDSTIWLILIDSLGNKIWDKRLSACSNLHPNNVFPLDLIRLQDGNFMVATGISDSLPCGYVSEISRGSSDYWIVKIDQNGNKIWDKRFGGPGYDFAYKIMELRPGKYIVCGLSNGAAGGDKTLPVLSDPIYHNTNIWLVCFTDSTAMTTGVAETNFSSDLKVYPNPANDAIHISCNVGLKQATLYNISGKMIATYSGNTQQLEQRISSLLPQIDNGFYVLKCLDIYHQTHVTKLIHE